MSQAVPGLPPGLQNADSSYLMQLELFLKIEYVCTIPKEVWMKQDLIQLAVLILYYDSTGCGEMSDYFATDADEMVAIVFEVDKINDLIRIFIFNRNIY